MSMLARSLWCPLAVGLAASLARSPRAHATRCEPSPPGQDTRPPSDGDSSPAAREDEGEPPPEDEAEPPTEDEPLPEDEDEDEAEPTPEAEPAPPPDPENAPENELAPEATPPAKDEAVDVPEESDHGTVEVVVRSESDADRRRHSAEAVHVIETEDAKRQTADMGEVLARSEGVGVRRSGGLGSDTRFSLNGLTDDQIRFFLDGIPLDMAGYPLGISNVPVNLVDRVEVFRGVVPIRFGADALGGAVNLVTDDVAAGTHGAVSYQGGSFGTHRATAAVRHLHEPSGFFVGGSGFFDRADNDYEIDVEVTDPMGRLSPARVHRFHDAYRAAGGSVELGAVDQRWGDRLTARAFFSDSTKELQHNVVMTVPYGDVEYGARTSGASLRYENVVAGQVRLRLIGGYAYNAVDFVDDGECVYDWFGQCIFDRVMAGEIGPLPREQVIWDHNGYARVNVEWRPHAQHALLVTLAPTFTRRTGDSLLLPAGARDPLSAQRDLFTLVSGVEYHLDLLDDRLQNIAFFKDYAQVARAEDPVTALDVRRRDRDTHRVGVGDSLRYRFLPWLHAKASYEWATRLPRTDELFGNGVLISPNLELQPEVSHNANLSVTADVARTQAGGWRASVNGFLRDADRLIVLLGTDRFFTYENVFAARSAGVEGAVGWTSPGEYVVLDGNVTYLDFRNTSSEGTFGDFEGDRIPNRPYLFANGSARAQLRKLAADDDALSVEWNTRYVHGFFRSWESVGLAGSKHTVPAQLLHSLALTYRIRGPKVGMSFTTELQNLTNAAAFDFFGVQRPGRAFYCKTTFEF